MVSVSLFIVCRQVRLSFMLLARFIGIFRYRVHSHKLHSLLAQVISFSSHPSHPYGGQRVLLLSISRFLCTVSDNKTLYMPNKVCVLFISLREISHVNGNCYSDLFHSLRVAVPTHVFLRGWVRLHVGYLFQHVIHSSIRGMNRCQKIK